MSLEKRLATLKNVSKQLNIAKKSYVKVGLPAQKSSSKVYENGDTVIGIGIKMEYGTSKIPRRSWLRHSLNANNQEINNHLKKGFTKILQGKSTSIKEITIFGIYARNIVVKAFSTNGYNSWVPLSEATIKDKNSNVALTRTGLLKQSIAWETNI